MTLGQMERRPRVQRLLPMCSASSLVAVAGAVGVAAAAAAASTATSAATTTAAVAAAAAAAAAVEFKWPHWLNVATSALSVRRPFGAASGRFTCRSGLTWLAGQTLVLTDSG